MAATRTARVTLLVAALAAAVVGCRATLNAAQQTTPSAVRDERQRFTASAFFRSPRVSHVALSPDGRHLAGIVEREGVEVVFALPTDGGKLRVLGKVERTETRTSFAIRALGWGGNERVLVSLESPYLKAVGVRARQTRLMVLMLDGSRPRYLGAKWPWQEYSGAQDDVIAWHIPDDPDHILLNWWKPGDSGVSACRVDTGSGKLHFEARARPGMLRWHANHLGQVLAGSGARLHGTDVFLLARARPEDRFQELIRFDYFDEPGFEFAAFSETPGQIYVWARGAADRRSLQRYDLASRSLGERVFEHPEVDLDGLWSSPRDGHLIAVGYTTDRRHWHFVDEAMQHEQAAIDRALPGTWNEIVDMDAAERLAVVVSSSDVVAPRYYLYDRERRQMHAIFEAYPQLSADQMAPMQPIRFEARDGLAIHGYLTRPRDAAPGPLPMILLPHGGPTARDVWGWDPAVQFLASRGFAVLQVNFRGSSGYGSRHERLGYQQWGLAMQDDLTDAARWAIEQGIADPGRMGIYGASYGGYAALMALVKTPELFRAGASLAGVSDRLEFLDDIESYRFADFNAPVHGDSGQDRDELAATSPARQAERIRAPVLIAHGTQDPVVHVKQAHAMIDALEAAGRDVEFYLYEGEVHGFIDERNAIDFYTRLADFFERHLTGPARP